MKIYEQADVSGGNTYYSWIVDGAKKSESPGAGWKFVGRKCHVTNSISLAIAAATRLGVQIVSNGTHAVHGVPMSNAAAVAN